MRTGPRRYEATHVREDDYDHLLPVDSFIKRNLASDADGYEGWAKEQAEMRLADQRGQRRPGHSVACSGKLGHLKTVKLPPANSPILYQGRRSA